jgi:two-component system nitrogen regulation response regulator GlnG
VQQFLKILIESELFGHEKGSFTGATDAKAGQFELCHKGTLFLDEIGDMGLPLRLKFLRAIQEGEIQRVGATKTKKVDVRLIAATHKNLEKMVKLKEFREDLYYRLNVVRIETPPLRNRMEDLPELIDFMLQRLNKNHSTGTTEISREAMELLKKYNWPGNVRELENVLHSASVISKGKRILTKDLPETVLIKAEQNLMPSANDLSIDSNKDSDLPTNSPTDKESPFTQTSVSRTKSVTPSFGKNADSTDSLSAPSSISPNEAYDIAYASARTTTDINLLEIVEKEMIQRSLKESGGNQVKASAMLGITRATLRKRIDSHNIRY